MYINSYYIDVHFPYKQFDGFLHPLIKDYIINNLKYITYVNKKNIKCKIYTENNNDITDIVNQIYLIHDYLVQEYNVKDVINFKFNLYLTPFLKTLNFYPETKENIDINNIMIKYLKTIKGLKYNYSCFMNPLDSLHINSGQTCNETFTISIWRKDEWEKVFMHELIHLYNLEKQLEFNIEFPIMSNNFKASSKELFTELQAWYLHIKYKSKDINKERLRAITDTHNILRKFNINDIRLFINNDQNHIINANSSVLYYYILKGIFIYNIDDIMDLLEPKKKWHGNMEQIYRNLICNETFLKNFFKKV